MYLIPILIGVVNVYDGITCSMALCKVLEPINEVQEVLIPIKLNAKITFTAPHLGLRYLQNAQFLSL